MGMFMCTILKTIPPEDGGSRLLKKRWSISTRLKVVASRKKFFSVKSQ
jgi:hypothetical protein